MALSGGRKPHVCTHLEGEGKASLGTGSSCPLDAPIATQGRGHRIWESLMDRKLVAATWRWMCCAVTDIHGVLAILTLNRNSGLKLRQTRSAEEGPRGTRTHQRST
ncbi:unnamed protein product [Pleuronectes platessa]|uniref:Uncharacterized protein n=1 Tax=Pleuronectes platessa TaxID=8262 RepID=A0A9N7UCK6_PLEPL|nr:unnamed protein product [Pleuronectes platessa]